VIVLPNHTKISRHTLSHNFVIGAVEQYESDEVSLHGELVPPRLSRTRPQPEILRGGIAVSA
jgi:hypothetical protein